MNLPLLKGADVRGVYWADSLIRDPESHRTAVAELCALSARGRIRPRIPSNFPLKDSPTALERFASRTASGKIAIEI